MKKFFDQKNHPKGGIMEMMAIALPMMVSHACDTVMTFTDRLFLSKLGPMHMNAAMGGGLTSFMMIAFFLGLTGYTTALTAQYYGADKKDNCALVTNQAFIVSLLAYPVILLCRPLAHFIFGLSNLSADQLAYQTTYFNILLYGVIISLLRSCLSGFFCGIGRTKIVMLASTITMTVNIGVNYILIFGKCGMPALGIKGAAYGTIIGGLFGLIILIAAYGEKNIRREFNTSASFQYQKKLMMKLIKYGSPPGIEFFLNFLAFIFMIFIFYSMGPVAATATTIMFNWDMVAFVPLIGIEIGVTSLVGRYMGAGQPDTAHQSTMSGIKIGMIYSCVILFVFVFLTGHLVDIFSPHTPDAVFSAARPLAHFMLRMACLYICLDIIIVAFIGALRGAGDTLWAMWLMVSLHWSLVLIEFVSLKTLGFSVKTTWTMVVLFVLAFSLLIFKRYHSGAWRKLKIIEEPPAQAPVDVFHESPDL